MAREHADRSRGSSMLPIPTRLEALGREASGRTLSPQPTIAMSDDNLRRYVADELC
jgi:hypothetical protein